LSFVGCFFFVGGGCSSSFTTYCLRTRGLELGPAWRFCFPRRRRNCWFALHLMHPSPRPWRASWAGLFSLGVAACLRRGDTQSPTSERIGRAMLAFMTLPPSPSSFRRASIWTHGVGFCGQCGFSQAGMTLGYRRGLGAYRGAAKARRWELTGFEQKMNRSSNSRRSLQKLC